MNGDGGGGVGMGLIGDGGGPGSGDAGGVEGGIGGDGGALGGPQRGPQSVQSEPRLHELYWAPAPPSSHSPSEAKLHVSVHSDGACGVVVGGGDGDGDGGG